jgi:hypothetical protein
VGNDGGVKQGDPDRSKVKAELSSLYKKLQRSYLIERFSNQALRGVTDEVFKRFRIEVLENREWKTISERLKVDDGPGCLLRYVNAFVMGSAFPGGASESQRSFARQCLEDLFIRALGNDIDLYRTGTAEQVLAAIDGRVFDQALTHMISSALNQMAERTAKRLPRGARTKMREVTEEQARDLCDRFRTKYHGKKVGTIPQVTMPDLFHVLSDPAAADWFIKELREL